jgi:geranylgeranyl diphosphate synthase, type I
MTLQSPAPPRLPASSAFVADKVDAQVDDLLSAEIDRWHSLDPTLAEPLVALRQLVRAGGKRLRPAFAYWGYVGCGGDASDDAVFDIGAAFEVLHAFALVHDDVMDGATTRRGLTATHVAEEARHRGEGWRGEARRYGEAVAVLVGDLAHVYADLFLDRAAQSAGPVGQEVRSLWNELRLELNMGQYLDVVGTARADRSPATARRIARYKSGRYTIERPLHLGCALAGRMAESADALSAYGDPLGEAFQLRDDVLGAVGDPTVTGKPSGRDLREGKPTPLLALACQKATADQAALLERVGREELTDDDVSLLQDTLRATGALAAIEDRIELLTSDAVAALDKAGLTPEARAALGDLAEFVMARAD